MGGIVNRNGVGYGVRDLGKKVYGVGRWGKPIIMHNRITNT
jgi:hypothetical protein